MLDEIIPWKILHRSTKFFGPEDATPQSKVITFGTDFFLFRLTDARADAFVPVFPIIIFAFCMRQVCADVSVCIPTCFSQTVITINLRCRPCYFAHLQSSKSLVCNHHTCEVVIHFRALFLQTHYRSIVTDWRESCWQLLRFSRLIFPSHASHVDAQRLSELEQENRLPWKYIFHDVAP